MSSDDLNLVINNLVLIIVAHKLGRTHNFSAFFKCQIEHTFNIVGKDAIVTVNETNPLSARFLNAPVASSANASIFKMKNTHTFV